MLVIKELENGKVEVSSDKGYVDINGDPAKKIICSREEVDYVTEVTSE